MNEYIISQNCNGVHYAYSRGRFWRWDESAHVWKESHLLAQKFGKAKTVEKRLTPEAFLTSNEFIPMDDYELPDQMLTALRDAKPCRNAPVEPVEECTAPVPAHTADVAEPCGNVPASPSFDFSALGDLSGQAAEADHQFDLHYGTAQDEYLISCIYLARVHALTAKAGRYGGGTWTKWYESKGLSHGSATKMVQNGDAFKSSTVDELKCLPELTRKDLNLIARSGCAEQLTAAAGDSQRVQDLLAQIKAEKERADAAEAERDKLLGAQNRAAWAESHIQDVEAQRDAALADVQGLTEQNAKLQQSYHDADESRIAANLQRQKAEAERDRAEARAKDAENQLAGSRKVAEAAKLRGDKLKAENDALKSQPITAVVDKEETRRQAKEMADAMNAELQAKLDAVTGDAEQDARNAYDSVLLASRAMLNTWQMVKPQFRKLPEEQREALANQIVHTIGSIQGEVSQCL